MSGMGSMIAYADNLDVTTIMNGGSSLENSSLSGLGTKVDDLGGGAYQLVYKVGVYIVVIGFIVAGLRLIFSNSMTRKEAKGSLLATVCGGVLIFAAVGIVVYLQTIGRNLFG